MKNKKKEHIFYWEEEPKKKITFEEKLEPFEFTINFPKFIVPNTDYSTQTIDKGKYLMINLKLSGFKKNEISLNITDNFLEVFAKKQEEKIKRDERSYISSSSSSSVHRSFSLPCEVNPDKSEAHLQDGVLVVILPKSQEHEKKKKKKLEIK